MYGCNIYILYYILARHLSINAVVVVVVIV